MFNNSLPSRVDLCNKKIFFKEGVIGFSNVKNYFFIDRNQSPFYWIQSSEGLDVSFLLVKMQILCDKYALSVDPKDLEDVEIDSVSAPDDLEDFLIVTLDPSNEKELTANFAAPVIINNKKCLGKQVLSLNLNFHTKHSILNQLAQYSVKNQRLAYAGFVEKT